MISCDVKMSISTTSIALVVLLLHVGAVVVVVATEWDDPFITPTQKLKLCETDERRLAMGGRLKKCLNKVLKKMLTVPETIT